MRRRADEGGLAGRRCSCSGHQYRPDAVGREGIAEFQGFLSDASTVRPLMSAAWTPSRARDRVRGLAADPDAPGPAWRDTCSGPGGAGSTWPWPEPSSGRRTARGRGCTGQGLCVLHEPPHLMKYPRTLPSSTRPSCNGPRPGRATWVTAPVPAGWAGDDCLARSARSRCHEMS